MTDSDDTKSGWGWGRVLADLIPGSLPRFASWAIGAILTALMSYVAFLELVDRYGLSTILRFGAWVLAGTVALGLLGLLVASLLALKRKYREVSYEKARRKHAELELRILRHDLKAWKTFTLKGEASQNALKELFEGADQDAANAALLRAAEEINSGSGDDS